MRPLALLAVWVWRSSSRPCPERTTSLRSQTRRSSGSPTVEFVSEVDEELELFWVDEQGREVGQGVIQPLSDASRTSFAGHAFRVRFGDTTLREYVVEEGRRQKVRIEACGELSEASKSRAPSVRDAEFARLTHDLGAPCVGPSKTWSCVRYLTMDDLAARSPEEYGIQPNETTPDRAYLTVDDTYVAQIPRIPRVTLSPGYQKMSFTQPLRDLLSDWYLQRRNDSLKRHGTIPGGYTNNDVVEIDKVNLDEFPAVHRALVREMRQILEWWTGLKLRHTSTFGVRVYRRGSALINHVDRMDTHLASAVIQIYQDADRGWPLELYLPNRTVAEVYLQPGELVLYEGAWLRHGRPMRFQGTEFANVFSHFAPPDWHGPRGDDLPLYYGIPTDRATTLADDPGVLTSDYFRRRTTDHRDEL